MITATCKLNVTAEGTTVQGNKTVSITPAGSAFAQSVESIGTTATPLPTAGLSDLRYVYLANPSTTATCTVTMAAIVLRPGDAAVFPPGSGNVTLQASAASTDIHAVIAES